MSKKKNEIPNWAKLGHQKPVTRREFLATGIIPFAATAISPQLLNLLLGENAYAQTMCPTPQRMIPVVTLNLSGGAGLSANFVPMDQGGQKLTSYNLMGLGLGSRLNVVREFGNVPFAGPNVAGQENVGKFLVGLQSAAPQATRDRTAFVGVNVRTGDDTGNNPYSIDGLLLRAGLVGTYLPNLGRNNNGVGINARPAILTPQAPLIVSNFTTITNSLGFSQNLGQSLTKAQQNQLARFVSNVNATQSNKLMNMKDGKDVKTLVECAGIKNVDITNGNPAGIDPRTNAAVSQVWGINANTANGDQNLVFAAMVFNAIGGNSGPVSLEVGGYDYHDGTRTEGDRKDREAGVIVGRILQTAAVMNSELFIYVTTDGSVTGPQNDTPGAGLWTSDRGAAGSLYMIHYSPTARKQTVAPAGHQPFQLGHFTQGQQADSAFFTGGNAELAAAAVFANYMKLNNNMALFEQIVGARIPKDRIDQILRFA
jgi:hypothetical protein